MDISRFLRGGGGGEGEVGPSDPVTSGKLPSTPTKGWSKRKDGASASLKDTLLSLKRLKTHWDKQRSTVITNMAAALKREPVSVMDDLDHALSKSSEAWNAARLQEDHIWQQMNEAVEHNRELHDLLEVVGVGLPAAIVPSVVKDRLFFSARCLLCGANPSAASLRSHFRNKLKTGDHLQIPQVQSFKETRIKFSSSSASFGVGGSVKYLRDEAVVWLARDCGLPRSTISKMLSDTRFCEIMSRRPTESVCSAATVGCVLAENVEETKIALQHVISEEERVFLIIDGGTLGWRMGRGGVLAAFAKVPRLPPLLVHAEVYCSKTAEETAEFIKRALVAAGLGNNLPSGEVVVDRRLVGVMADGGSEILPACNLVGIERFRCAAHAMNRACAYIIEKAKPTPQVHTIAQLARAFSAVLKVKTLRASFAEEFPDASISKLTFSETRWINSVGGLAFLSNNRDEVRAWAEKVQPSDPLAKNVHLSNLTRLLSLDLLMELLNGILPLLELMDMFLVAAQVNDAPTASVAMLYTTIKEILDSEPVERRCQHSLDITSVSEKGQKKRIDAAVRDHVVIVGTTAQVLPMKSVLKGANKKLACLETHGTATFLDLISSLEHLPKHWRQQEEDSKNADRIRQIWSKRFLELLRKIVGAQAITEAAVRSLFEELKASYNRCDPGESIRLHINTFLTGRRVPPLLASALRAILSFIPTSACVERLFSQLRGNVPPGHVTDKYILEQAFLRGVAKEWDTRIIAAKEGLALGKRGKVERIGVAKEEEGAGDHEVGGIGNLVGHKRARSTESPDEEEGVRKTRYKEQEEAWIRYLEGEEGEEPQPHVCREVAWRDLFDVRDINKVSAYGEKLACDARFTKSLEKGTNEGWARDLQAGYEEFFHEELQITDFGVRFAWDPRKETLPELG